ncbi:MAG: alanyl-tRNA editing protein, partial [Oligoflexia bacterium]|nr:alanyl-tRNA editing protein [Oligoflexia bacterium]
MPATLSPSPSSSAPDLLASQREPQRARGSFTVLACTPRPDGRYDLLLDDSLLYAEGGGQPTDHGTVGGVRVVDVQKVEGGVRHVATAAVPPGPAQVVVAWERRFDHMQQHTAQHLLTAIAQDRLELATVGFHLGASLSTIDLDGPLSKRDRDRLEIWANDEIRANRPVSHQTVTVAQYGALDVRSRGLPAGHTGPVRLVAIDGLDLNTCGGTHVSSLGQIQLVHILRTERGKAGSRLHFLAGGRVVDRLTAVRQREQALTELLTCPPEEHVASVMRLQASLKTGMRSAKHRDAELAELLGRALGQTTAQTVLRLHREDGDMAFLQRVAKA